MREPWIGAPTLDPDRMEPERADWVTTAQLELLAKVDACPTHLLSAWELNFRGSVRNQHDTGAIFTQPQLTKLFTIARRPEVAESRKLETPNGRRDA